MRKLVSKYARENGLDPAIVYGVCMAESSMNHHAARYELDYRWLFKPGEFAGDGLGGLADETRDQKTSWGLMQVMGAVLREMGYAANRCSDILFDVDAQLHYGCKHLAKKIKKYGLHMGILAYNSGSPRRNADGTFVNAQYLEKVKFYSASWEDVDG